MLTKVAEFNYGYQLDSLRLSVTIFIDVICSYYYIIKYYVICIFFL